MLLTLKYGLQSSCVHLLAITKYQTILFLLVLILKNLELCVFHLPFYKVEDIKPAFDK